MWLGPVPPRAPGRRVSWQTTEGCPSGAWSQRLEPGTPWVQLTQHRARLAEPHSSGHPDVAACLPWVPSDTNPEARTGLRIWAGPPLHRPHGSQGATTGWRGPAACPEARPCAPDEADPATRPLRTDAIVRQPVSWNPAPAPDTVYTRVAPAPDPHLTPCLSGPSPPAALTPGGPAILSLPHQPNPDAHQGPSGPQLSPSLQPHRPSPPGHRPPKPGPCTLLHTCHSSALSSAPPDDGPPSQLLRSLCPPLHGRLRATSSRKPFLTYPSPILEVASPSPGFHT